MPYSGCLVNDTNGGDQLMGSAAQGEELSSGISEIGRLIKPSFATD
jgi:hypothetical protein